jgi:TIR domain
VALITVLCYVQKEEQMARDLKKHLSSLERNGKITLWDFGNISPGTEQKREVNKYLNEAQIILLLISAEFLASDYHYEVAIKQAIERHEHKEASVIPVIMRPVHWHEAPLDKLRLQALPDDAKPVTEWRTQAEGFKNIVEGLIKVIKQWETHNLAEPTAERKIFMEKFFELVEAVKLQLQPPPRAIHTAGTLEELSIYTPNETTLADLIVGWQLLSHSTQQEEDVPTSLRRITCGELASLASQLTTEQGNLAQAIKTWRIWRDAFTNSDDPAPRKIAMAKTFARELAELQAAV